LCIRLLHRFIVKSRREGLDTCLNTSQSEILAEDVATLRIQLATSSVTLDALLNTFDE
jgi:hypothetical protein